MSALKKAADDLTKVADELDQYGVDLINEGGKHLYAGTIAGVVGVVRFLVDAFDELENRSAHFSSDSVVEKVAAEVAAQRGAQ